MLMCDANRIMLRRLHDVYTVRYDSDVCLFAYATLETDPDKLEGMGHTEWSSDEDSD